MMQANQTKNRIILRQFPCNSAKVKIKNVEVYTVNTYKNHANVPDRLFNLPEKKVIKFVHISRCLQNHCLNTDGNLTLFCTLVVKPASNRAAELLNVMYKDQIAIVLKTTCCTLS